MRTGFMYSLYFFSSFVQGSLLLSAANVVSHACTLARTLPACHVPHCSTQTPCSGLTQGQTPNTIRNSQRSTSWAQLPALHLQLGGDVKAVITGQPRALPRVLHSRAITF